eukprot:4504294-Amphidinium_carterae.1
MAIDILSDVLQNRSNTTHTVSGLHHNEWASPRWWALLRYSMLHWVQQVWSWPDPWEYVDLPDHHDAD